MSKLSLISVGSSGSAFVSLNEKDCATLKLNEENACLAKNRLTDAQFDAYKAGRNSGALWVDSASWLAGRDEKFFIGTLEQALAAGVVRKATVTVKVAGKLKKLSGYVRATWNASEKFDHSIAIEKGGVNGRIETRTINDKRNALYVRRVESVEVV